MALKKEVAPKAASSGKSEWFYYTSIFSSFIFTIYISIYAAIHFEEIRYMNLALIFLFFTLTVFFLISWVHFYTEKMGFHIVSPLLFLAGIVYLIFYAYTAVDASDIVRYSIMYTIIVSGFSLFVLLSRNKPNQIPKGPKIRQNPK